MPVKWTMWGVATHARGMLTTRGSGAGHDFQSRSQAEVVRSSAWALIGQAYQEGSGRVRNRARSLLNWFRQGPALGEMQGEATGLAGMRPARKKKRRRRVLVVATGSPKPMSAVRVDSGRGQNRTLTPLWSPVFAGEHYMGPP